MKLPKALAFSLSALLALAALPGCSSDSASPSAEKFCEAAAGIPQVGDEDFAGQEAKLRELSKYATDTQLAEDLKFIADATRDRDAEDFDTKYDQDRLQDIWGTVMGKVNENCPDLDLFG
ncbi:MAG: hypothetical protein FWG16_06495 [Micrococcales bacterium]|nr:hypothetical protein [Micrococcales bacterium]